MFDLLTNLTYSLKHLSLRFKHLPLKTIGRSLSPLLDKLDDSLLAAGSDAYAQALEVYGYAKAAGTGDGLDQLRRSMSHRFSRTRRAEGGSEDPVASAE